MKRTLITLFISTLLCAATFAFAQSQTSDNAPTPKKGKTTERGAIFGVNPISPKQDKLAIVYALDVSGSMRYKDKIGKAKSALKQAVSTLKPTDQFAIVTFASYPEAMSPKMLAATPDNVKKANDFIDIAELRDGTNFSNAMEASLSFGKISSLFFLSDGEPHGGIVEQPQLLAFIREKNKHRVPIITLALGVGDNFPGTELLKAIAKDNFGKYDYINAEREKTEFPTGERKSPVFR